MKKGQIQQIFTWIIILIIAVSVLFFGVKLLRQTQDFTNEGALIDFYKSLERKINNYYYLDKDSSGVEEFILPSGVKKVCFTMNEGTFTDSYLDSLKAYSNVFVRPESEFKENRVNITNFFVVDNPECVPVSGSVLKIRLTNDGVKGVKIEKL